MGAGLTDVMLTPKERQDLLKLTSTSSESFKRLQGLKLVTPQGTITPLGEAVIQKIRQHGR